jgi:dihydrofolate reductase/predicted enzyme related to lactoylglutathione lyase
MSWAHKQDAEWNSFVEGNASGGGVLLFGRITYELMAGYWPTAQASQNAPVVAERINNLPKVVFSRTLDKASWNNTKLVKDGMAAEIRKMKNEPGPDMVIMGSGSIVSQLAQESLIDEYQIVVNPVVLGKGRTMFEGIKEKLTLKLTKTRTFGNGNVLLCYQPLSEQPALAKDKSESTTVSGLKDGQVCYLQIPALDMMKSADFYETIFGWRIERPYPSFEAPGLIGQWVSDRPAAAEAGLLAWINVSCIDGVVESVRSSGGDVLKPPSPDGPRWLATIRDPAGNVLGIVQHGPRRAP